MTQETKHGLPVNKQGGCSVKINYCIFPDAFRPVSPCVVCLASKQTVLILQHKKVTLTACGNVSRERGTLYFFLSRKISSENNIALVEMWRVGWKQCWRSYKMWKQHNVSLSLSAASHHHNTELIQRSSQLDDVCQVHAM